MKLKYTAKLYFEDGSLMKKHSDDLSQLINWMRHQGHSRSSEVNGLIFNNKMHRVIRSIEYNPAEDI